VSGATVKRITGLGLGFQAWTEPATEVRPAPRRCPTRSPGSRRRRAFFLWFHTFDAHAPPREDNRQYLREFAADAVVKKLMAELHIRGTIRGKHNGGATCSAPNRSRSTTPACASSTTR